MSSIRCEEVRALPPLYKFMYVEINFFAMAVLFLVYLNIRHSKEKYLLEQKLFLALLGSNALVLFLDSGMWFLNGSGGPGARALNLVVTTVYYIMNPVICMIWSWYAHYQIYRDEKRLKALWVPTAVPAVVNGVLSLVSVYTNCLFYIDAGNVYHRGLLFYLMVVICYGYLMVSLVLILRERKRIEKKYFLPIMGFFFPPFIGGIIQAMFYGISLIWVCMTLSIMLIFINLQNNQLYTDHLTGLYNRRQLDYYLEHRLTAKTSKSVLAGVMIDLNGFKAINDRYGHHVGDEALVHVADILRSAFGGTAFISRYGGDEFVVIQELTQEGDLEPVIGRLKKQVRRFNEENALPYSVSLSVGYGCFPGEPEQSAYGFIHHLDEQMYEDKQRYKANQLGF